MAGRWEELEARLRTVESRLGIGATDRPPLPDPKTFWVLDGLRARGDEGVAFAGDVDTAAGPVAWQYGHPTEALTAPVLGAAPDALSRSGRSPRGSRGCCSPT